MKNRRNDWKTLTLFINLKFLIKQYDRAASSCHVAAGREVESRGGRWDKNQSAALNGLHVTDVRPKHNSCRSAYNLIARMLHHLHQIAIDCGGTPALSKSPAMPALKACGDTNSTRRRTAPSCNGRAASNASCSHRFRCALDVDAPRTGAYTSDSPARCN